MPTLQAVLCEDSSLEPTVHKFDPCNSSKEFGERLKECRTTVNRESDIQSRVLLAQLLGPNLPEVIWNRPPHMEGRERLRKEAGRPSLGGGRFNKQGNL